MHPNVCCTITYNSQEGKQPKRPSTEQGIKKDVVHIYNENHSAINQNQIVSVTETWLDLEAVIESVVLEREEILYINAYMCNLEKWYI